MQSDFEIQDGVLKKYHGTDSRVMIPEGVTALGDRAFENCSHVIEINFPKSIISVGMDVFKGTAWLEHYPDDFVIINDILVSYRGKGEEAVIPEHIRKIRSYAFFKTKNLKKIVIPEGVTSIPRGAFCLCSGLKSIRIPDSVTEIESSAFVACNNLETIITKYDAYPHEILYNQQLTDIFRLLYGNHPGWTANRIEHVLRILILHRCTPTFRMILHSEKFQKYIPPELLDALILSANKNQAYEIQLLLMEYKNQKNSYLDIGENLKL